METECREIQQKRFEQINLESNYATIINNQNLITTYNHRLIN